MNQFQEFARLSPGADAIGRSLVAPPCGAPATIPHQHQTWTDTERGLAREVMCPSALDVAQGWPLRRAECTRRNHYRGRNNPGLFTTGGRRVNASLAVNYQSADHAVRNAVQPFECHSKTSVYLGPEPSDGGMRSVPKQAGEFPKGQGERRHVICV